MFSRFPSRNTYLSIMVEMVIMVAKAIMVMVEIVIMVDTNIMLVMVAVVIMVNMITRTDRADRTTRTSGKDKSKRIDRTDIFKLDFPGNLCRAAFAILAMSHQGTVFHDRKCLPICDPLRIMT